MTDLDRWLLLDALRGWLLILAVVVPVALVARRAGALDALGRWLGPVEDEYPEGYDDPEPWA